MPDILSIFFKWWKMILGLTLLAALLALAACLLSPKQYASVATALPGNSVLSDKGRIFNENLQYLYSRLGSPDELDRIEGTAALDTIYIAAAAHHQLVQHYSIDPSPDALLIAALELKGHSKISRSGYGELKVRVWDKDRHLASALANTLLENLQEFYRNLLAHDNAAILQGLREELGVKQRQLQLASDSLRYLEAAADTMVARRDALLEQVKELEKLSAEYELTLQTTPQVLITVEQARPSLKPDKPRIAQTVLLTAFASLVFFFLLALLIESRKRP
jgi:hypothetical protein